MSTIAFALAGILLGLFFFATLRWNIALYLSRRTAGLALQLGRLAVVVLGLVLVAHAGATPLVATFVGFLIARSAVLRGAREER
jgi:F1F0 ATPase subunit 2